MENKRVAVVGVAVSNTDCVRLFRRHGVAVTVCDRKPRAELAELADEFEALGCTLRLGDGYLDGLDADLLLRTPGLYYKRPELTALRARGVAVTSETELFFELCPCPIYAVTGSDGKTTTTTLIAKLLQMSGKRVWLGGNIGKALLPVIDEVTPDDVAVAELSSFQLLSMRVSPDVAVVTNLAPNHLDVHRDMEEYIDAKRNIFAHQRSDSRTVLNLDNEITRGFAPDVRGELLGFSSRGEVERGVWLEDGVIWARRGGEPVRVMAVSDIRLPGMHNVEDWMTATAATLGDVDLDLVRRLAPEFGGVEHRCELVRVIDGVRWFNDSIGSAPTRTIANLKALGRAVLIAGGYDKKIPYEPLAPYVLTHVSRLIVMGATGPKIEEAVRACPGFDEAALPIERAADLADAVAKARAAARDGDAVLFSPASASFDLYRNFEERGRHFKLLVNAL